MPRPLSDTAGLSPDELDLYEAQAAKPLADLGPILADAALDRGQQHRPALLTQQARLPILELLRGRALPEAACAAAAGRIRALLDDPPAAGRPAAEGVLSAALGPPRGDGMLALLDHKTGALDPVRLREQYDFQTA